MGDFTVIKLLGRATSGNVQKVLFALEEMGVDYLQGWGIGRPKPLAEITSGNMMPTASP